MRGGRRQSRPPTTAPILSHVRQSPAKFQPKRGSGAQLQRSQKRNLRLFDNSSPAVVARRHPRPQHSRARAPPAADHCSPASSSLSICQTAAVHQAHAGDHRRGARAASLLRAAAPSQPLSGCPLARHNLIPPRHDGPPARNGPIPAREDAPLHAMVPRQLVRMPPLHATDPSRLVRMPLLHATTPSRQPRTPLSTSIRHKTSGIWLKARFPDLSRTTSRLPARQRQRLRLLAIDTTAGYTGTQTFSPAPAKWS